LFDEGVFVTQRDGKPRVPRIPADQRTPEMLDIISMFAGAGRINVDNNYVLTTFINHPDLARSYLAFNRYLLMSSTLPVRFRQLAIMRVAWLKKGRYVWASHLRTSLRNGLHGEDFPPIKEGEHSAYWSEQEKAVLRATDQMMEDNDIDEATWSSLSQFLETKQRLDFVFTVGAYALLSVVCNAIRIEREQDLLDLVDIYGEPT
jgi:4-carboxymuconolactone decarboxylase